MVAPAPATFCPGHCFKGLFIARYLLSTLPYLGQRLKVCTVPTVSVLKPKGTSRYLSKIGTLVAARGFRVGSGYYY